MKGTFNNAALQEAARQKSVFVRADIIYDINFASRTNHRNRRVAEARGNGLSFWHLRQRSYALPCNGRFLTH
jgi:hypothetical protein